MRQFYSGRIQDKLINRIDRHERQQAFEQDRFFKFKLDEIHNQLSQTLLMQKIIETDNAASISDSLYKGLQKARKSTEFDFKYFISPIRNLVPRPNLISLYMTQYIMEVLIDDPDVLEIYGTDLEIYEVVNKVMSQIKTRFERDEGEIITQLAHNKSLTPGTTEYEIALDQLIRKKIGEPQKQ